VEAAVFRLGGLFETAAAPVVEPAVVEAAQTAAVETAEGQVDAAVGAEPADQPVAAGAAEQHEVLAEQAHRLHGPLRGQLAHQRRGLPVRPQQPAARGVAPGAGQQLVVLARQHRRLHVSGSRFRFPVFDYRPLVRYLGTIAGRCARWDG
jgi:hypothetical protein